MSRIGNKPIEIPAGVTVDVAPGRVTVNGPKGELSQDLSRDMEVKVDESVLTVARPTDRGEHRALHGLTRSLIANMVEGVTNGFEKRLQIQGVGYRAKAQGKALELSLGFSHPINMKAPGRDRLRGPAADRDHRPRHRQAARRRDGGADPPPPPAGAVQGQGRSLRRRAGPPQGRQEGIGASDGSQDRRTEKAAPPAARPGEDPRQRGVPAAGRLPIEPGPLRPVDRRRPRATRSPRRAGPRPTCVSSTPPSGRSGPAS